MDMISDSNSSYAEASVKKKETFMTMGIRVLMIAFAVFLFFIAFAVKWMMLIATVLICIDILLMPFLKIEYEYIFCDGQLDFDRINGGARRKHLLRIDLEEVEIVAPKNSHALDEFHANTKGTTKDFSSGKDSDKTYVMIVNQNGNVFKILFEPSEKMIICMKNKSPRKVVDY